MEKRGLGLMSIILLIVLALGIIGLIIFLFLGGDSESSSEDSEEIINEGQQGLGEVNETVEIEVCSDYEGQEDCEADLESVGVCEDENSTCVCFWSVNASSCELLEEVEVEVEEEPFFDLTAINLNLTNEGCVDYNESETNITVKNCSIHIIGTFKNIGNSAIDIDFIVQFLDAGSGSSLIDLFSVEDEIGIDEEKELSLYYDDISPGNYFIKMVVDSAFNINESDENNNDITKVVQL